MPRLESVKKKVLSEVNDSIENLFYNNGEDYSIESGDISPCQDLKLDIIKNNLAQLIAEWVIQNKT